MNSDINICTLFASCLHTLSLSLSFDYSNMHKISMRKIIKFYFFADNSPDKNNMNIIFSCNIIQIDASLVVI